MLSDSQIEYLKLILRNHTSKEEPKKGTKHKKTEKYDIKGVVSKAKLQICNFRIIENANEREDIEAQQEIRVPYDCVIKLNFYYYFNIFINLYKYYFYWGRYLGVYDGTVFDIFIIRWSMLKMCVTISKFIGHNVVS